MQRGGFLCCNGLVESPLKTTIRSISPKSLSLCHHLAEGEQTEQTRGWRKCVCELYFIMSEPLPGRNRDRKIYMVVGSAHHQIHTLYLHIIYIKFMEEWISTTPFLCL